VVNEQDMGICNVLHIVLHIAIAVEFLSRDPFAGTRGDAASRVSTLASYYGGDSFARVAIP
jgi:hypothetical protein